MSNEISLEDAQSLIKLSGLVFPPEIIEKMKVFIVKNWSKRDGKKNMKQLIYEIDHTCTKEYLGKLLKGDQANKSWIDQIRQRYKDASENTDALTKKEMLDSIDLQIEEVSKIFTDGFFNVMKNNLMFNQKGEPISVKAGDDQKRFQQCHIRLTEDDFAKRAQKVGQRDIEAEGVTGQAFQKYGQGRKHKTRRRKLNKNKNKKLSKKLKIKKTSRK
jgi:hypothetical protein